MKPTIGRVVWYFPYNDTGVNSYEGHPLAAIIAYVWSDIQVNLAVFDANGITHARTTVPFVQAGQAAPRNDPYATWMPYQVGQAAKTEALQAELDAKFPTRAGE